MAKVFKCSDRLPIKIDDIEVKISPLTFQQRSELNGIISQATKTLDFGKAAEATFMAVKFSLKEISGVENYDGTPYELKFENGILTDESVNDILNLELSPKLGAVSVALINGVPDKIVDEKGNVVDGITLLYRETKSPNLKTPKKK